MLALVGRNAKETKDWDAIKIQLKPSLVQEMLGIDVTDVSDGRSGGGRTQRRQWPALISTNCSIQLQSSPIDGQAHDGGASQHVNENSVRAETYSGSSGTGEARQGEARPQALSPLHLRPDANLEPRCAARTSRA